MSIRKRIIQGDHAYLTPEESTTDHMRCSEEYLSEQASYPEQLDKLMEWEEDGTQSLVARRNRLMGRTGLISRMRWQHQNVTRPSSIITRNRKWSPERMVWWRLLCIFEIEPSKLSPPCWSSSSSLGAASCSGNMATYGGGVAGGRTYPPGTTMARMVLTGTGGRFGINCPAMYQS